MFEKYLRPTYQMILVDPLVRWIQGWTFLNPSLITLFGCLIGLLSAFFMHSAAIALPLLLFSGYCDTLDGTVARARVQATSFGTALDIVCDRFVECAVVIGLFTVHQSGYLSLIMLSAILICVTSFLVVGIFSENQTEKGFYYSPGLIERGEAFLFFSLMILFPSLYAPLAILFSGLVFLTAGIRLYQFAKKHI